MAQEAPRIMILKLKGSSKVHCKIPQPKEKQILTPLFLSISFFFASRRAEQILCGSSVDASALHQKCTSEVKNPVPVITAYSALVCASVVGE